MADTQRNSAQGGKGNGKVANWPPIQSGEKIDLVGRLNWLGRMTDLFRNAIIQPGAEDAVYVSDSNVILQYKAPDVLEKTLNTEAGVSGGSGSGGGGEPGDGWVWKGQWTDTNYDLGDVVIRETNAELIDGTVAGTYLALIPITTGTVAPGTPGSSASWALLARGNWDYLKVADSIVLDGAGEEVAVTDGAGIYTTIQPDRIQQQNSGGTTIFSWSMVGEQLAIVFSNGGTVNINVGGVAGRTVTMREIDVCDNGLPRKMLVLGSEVYD